MKISEISIDDRATDNSNNPCEGFPTFLIKANVNPVEAEFLNHSTTDILSWIILCRWGLSPCTL